MLVRLIINCDSLDQFLAMTDRLMKSCDWLDYWWAVIGWLTDKLLLFQLASYLVTWFPYAVVSIAEAGGSVALLETKITKSEVSPQLKREENHNKQTEQHKYCNEAKFVCPPKKFVSCIVFLTFVALRFN